MKKTLLSCIPLFAMATLNAQQIPVAGSLDINQVKAMVNANGDLWWDHSNSQFEVPINSGKHTIGAGALWIGGLDGSNQLHLAAQTYRQTGNDFYQGPYMSSGNYSSGTDAQWNYVWKINKTSIDSFLLWRANPSAYPTYTIPSSITSWPGNGNTALGQSATLAPFVDNNADGVYNPNDGDYPCIKGDQAIFFIFNDDRNTHGETGGAKLGVEVRALAYAYHVPGSPLDSTVFLNLKIVNHSATSYTNVYLGNFTDGDLGFYNDDYVGSDVMRHAYFFYNGTANDSVYGINPPAQGVFVLDGPPASMTNNVDDDRDGLTDEPGETCGLTYFMYYNNDFSVTGNPVQADDYYGYMTGYWTNGTQMTYGGTGYNSGGSPAMMAYPKDSDPNGYTTGFVPQPAWDEASANNMPGDRRGIGSSGPFDLSAGQSVEVDYGYVYARASSGLYSSMNRGALDIDSIRSFVSHQPAGCSSAPTGIAPVVNVNAPQLYPNPASESVLLSWPAASGHASYTLIDMTGRVVQSGTIESKNTSIDLQHLSAGLFMLTVQDDHQRFATKLIHK